MPDGPLKWHGGKAYLAKRIIELMPQRVMKPNAPASDDPGWIHYVEPYFGGGQVLFENNPEGISEVVNDLNKSLTNFWRVLQDTTQFAEFQRIVEAMPFSETEWKESNEPRNSDPGHAIAPKDPKEAVACAVSFFVNCRLSLAGRMKGFTGITKTRARRGMNNEVSAWLSAVEGLPEVHKRLKRVMILDGRPALDVIRGQDGPRTLFYLDPPYLHETRATTGEYQHEMTEQDHADLLETLKAVQGRFLLSGYPSPLYDDFAQRNGWRIVDFDLPNHSSNAKAKERKTERVWMNY